MTAVPPRPGRGAVKARLAEILRVDHAGELGAVHIYRGQRAVMGKARGYERTAAQLEEKVEFFAGPMNKRQILTLLNDHQTHHCGQLIVYLRLKGVKPPDYRGW